MNPRNNCTDCLPNLSETSTQGALKRAENTLLHLDASKEARALKNKGVTQSTLSTKMRLNNPQIEPLVVWHSVDETIEHPVSQIQSRATVMELPVDSVWPRPSPRYYTHVEAQL
ncbi:hypothetical protein CRM22_007402 [Opisthorchis felineus]|uniref:Uncharacterized protein n=1 Tax=Opisthorchis felineus TaxID=147828 RepID=A0A4S2LPE3_OPIFE|nr:hypothetical protein CRM22_007402 [Opisthorchis felineus]